MISSHLRADFLSDFQDYSSAVKFYHCFRTAFETSKTHLVLGALEF